MITRLFLTILVVYALCGTLRAQIHVGPGQSYPNIALAAGSAQPGDTIYIHAGSYRGYQGISKLKGRPGRWIVICPFAGDSTDISGGWQFMSCEYIKLSRLMFRSESQYPGRLLNVDNSGSCATQSRFIIIDSCRFSNTTDPNAICTLKFGGVDDFEVTHCCFRDLSSCDAMDFNVCHRGTISDNLMENCLSGGHIKGGSNDIIMERNLFLNAAQNGWVAFELGGDTGAMFYCDGDSTEVQNLSFRSNIVVSGYRGLALSSAVSCYVVNNTFYNCGQATLRLLTTSTKFPKVRANVIENNIFAFGASAYMNGSNQEADAASFANNIYKSINNSSFNGAYWDTPELDAVKDNAGIILTARDSLFRSASTKDFHLVAGSAAVAAGTSAHVPPLDFFGRPFHQRQPSIGAVERDDSIASAVPLLQESTLAPHILFVDDKLSVVGGQTDERSRMVVLVYDLYGRCCAAPVSGESNDLLSTTHLSNGVYIAVVSMGAMHLCQPLCVQR